MSLADVYRVQVSQLYRATIVPIRKWIATVDLCRVQCVSCHRARGETSQCWHASWYHVSGWLQGGFSAHEFTTQDLTSVHTRKYSKHLTSRMSYNTDKRRPSLAWSPISNHCSKGHGPTRHLLWPSALRPGSFNYLPVIMNDCADHFAKWIRTRLKCHIVQFEKVTHHQTGIDAHIHTG